MQVSFQSPNCCFLVELNKSPAAQEILRRLPLDSKVSLWGDEIYFQISITPIPASEATSDVNVGDVAYWSDGNSICVFFGPTPFSKDQKPVPVIPVVIIGKTAASAEELRKIQLGHPIRVMPVEDKLPAKTSILTEKKLSQVEIDVLVKQLLAAKSKS